jgi:hypothetical protein
VQPRRVLEALQVKAGHDRQRLHRQLLRRLLRTERGSCDDNVMLVLSEWFTDPDLTDLSAGEIDRVKVRRKFHLQYVANANDHCDLLRNSF